MTIHNDFLTKIDPVAPGHTIDPQRPVLPYWQATENAMCSAPHAHPRGQFIYSSQGITRVMTETGIYLLPSSQAFWCPPGHQHELYFLGAVRIANLFIDPDWCDYFPINQCVLNVTPLAQELILRAIQIGTDYDSDSKDYRLMVVVIDELSGLKRAPLALPWSNHPSLSKILWQLFEHPASQHNVEYWAAMIHTTPRTLARLFQQEVNMTFSEWRMQARLLYALEQLNHGKSVTYIALELGYSSPSAFIAAFKKIMQKSPLEYISAIRS
ncbi:helix-turn-helix domain-containing protein [Gynuella sunshinyii]|uniref:AraC-type DNA-binding domain-containing protein n=1 Tax=Gynuella sunshinyii YC6258 TaxID=1445510 RepID=A0A0C5VGR0_9GAMM|nr:helix-turn-helix transcriptional regulator [Gynuella sunshinyii]AJQ93401.1 araC-type DNA-binding domain-containing protein [Gynuella sunshinyii YC6258]